MRKDDPNHTAAYKIFHYEFDCTIPTMFLYSSEYLDVFGFSSSGDKNIDEGLAMAPTQCRLTIAAMATYHDEGAEIGLINPQDAVRIYEYVNQHLLDWRDSYKYDLNRRSAPTEDLNILENFATSVFRAARPFMANTPTNSKLFDFIDRNTTGIMKKQNEVNVNTPAVNNDVEHKNIINDLIVEVSKRNRRTLF